MLLDRLHETDGKAAFAQRAEKNQLRNAERPLASASAARGAAVTLRDIDKDEAVAVNAVQVVGDQVLYRRGNTWYSYDVAQAAAQPGAKIKVIERFSDEYFRLVRDTTRENQKILANQQDREEVIIRHPAAQAGMPAEVYRVKVECWPERVGLSDSARKVSRRLQPERGPADVARAERIGSLLRRQRTLRTPRV